MQLPLERVQKIAKIYTHQICYNCGTLLKSNLWSQRNSALEACTEAAETSHHYDIQEGDYDIVEGAHQHIYLYANSAIQVPLGSWKQVEAKRMGDIPRRIAKKIRSPPHGAAAGVVFLTCWHPDLSQRPTILGVWQRVA